MRRNRTLTDWKPFPTGVVTGVVTGPLSHLVAADGLDDCVGQRVTELLDDRRDGVPGLPLDIGSDRVQHPHHASGLGE